MKRGKREMYNGRGRKTKTALIALALVLCCAAGGTLAFLATQSGPVENTFLPTQVSSSVEETFENGVKSDVKIKNTGDIDAYIRAYIVVNWADAKGNVYGGATPVEDVDYTLSTGSKWFKDANGYYYYPSKVAPGEFTFDETIEDETEAAEYYLIKECKPEDGATVPKGYNLQVTILADAIQADGVDSEGTPAVETVWPVFVVDGKLSPTQAQA